MLAAPPNIHLRCSSRPPLCLTTTLHVEEGRRNCYSAATATQGVQEQVVECWVLKEFAKS